MKKSSALALLLVGACSSAEDGTDEANATSARYASFEEVRAKVYATPRTDLPEHPGLSTWDVVRNLVGSESRPTHGLSIRSRRTLVDESDERPAEPKWLHPRGACAEGEWRIDAQSPATGLFAKGVSALAIVRISSGDATSVYPESTDQGGGRILGMAIKLFPTMDKKLRIRTRNIVTLDQYGFERSPRRRTFHEDAGGSVYFTNVAPATSALGKFLSTFFDRFDNPNWARPLYGIAQANMGGSGNLSRYAAPYEIRIHAPESTLPEFETPLDFRDELRGMSNTYLAITLQSMDGTSTLAQRIGTLELKRFVVSDYCDLQLHFHHDSIEDQFEKYSDYAVVEDLLPDD